MFKIYYEDSTMVFSYEQEVDPQGNRVPQLHERGALKHTGIVAIVQDDLDVGWTIITGYEYYVYRTGIWIGTDFWGVLDYLEELGEIKLERQKYDLIKLRQIAKRNNVLSGIVLPKSRQEEIFAQVYSDKDLGPKAGWTHPERSIAVRAPRGKRYVNKTWEV